MQEKGGRREGAGIEERLEEEDRRIGDEKEGR